MTHISEPIEEIMTELKTGRIPLKCDPNFGKHLQWLRDFINEEFKEFKEEM